MELFYLATFVLAFISSLLSGIAGGGGGFLMAPYWLIAGLSPSQGAATGAFMAVGMGASSSFAFRKAGYLKARRRLVAVLLVITFFASLIGPFYLQYITIDSFKIALACLTLISLPLLFLKPKLTITHKTHISGYVVVAVLLLASSFIPSSAISIATSIVLVQMLGTTTLQSVAIRRLIGTLQSFIALVILSMLGFLVWQHAIAGILGGALGSYIGTTFAIKRGEQFAKYALAIGAIVGTTAMFFVG